MTHSTYYLYGIEPHELMEMEYKTALQFKLDCGTQLYNMLYSDREQDTARMHYVWKALEHTRGLLDELKADVE